MLLYHTRLDYIVCMINQITVNQGSKTKGETMSENKVTVCVQNNVETFEIKNVSDGLAIVSRHDETPITARIVNGDRDFMLDDAPYGLIRVYGQSQAYAMIEKAFVMMK
jgi:hypothetical protein